MQDDPSPLFHSYIPPDGPYDRNGRLIVPRRNAVHGRQGPARTSYRCRDCDARFVDRREAAAHAATDFHVVIEREFRDRELVPVDLDDDWHNWADGGGVSWADRNPGPQQMGGED